MTVPGVLLVAWVLMALLMVALWLWQRAHDDAGIVDAGWLDRLGSEAAPPERHAPTLK